MEQLIDIREISPHLRHPTIFRMWDELPTRTAILLINDHDPAPLYCHFATEYTGRFLWEYVEKGPAVWQVRISKGNFENPGFAPALKAGPSAVPVSSVETLILDTRPIFARGASPCDEIDQAVESLVPGQGLILLVPFEPAPLYAKLGRQGFSHQATHLEDGTWKVEFHRE